jgi:hypothetical protein
MVKTTYNISSVELLTDIFQTSQSGWKIRNLRDFTVIGAILVMGQKSDRKLWMNLTGVSTVMGFGHAPTF